MGVMLLAFILLAFSGEKVEGSHDKALLYGLLIPGGGQFYNGQPVKGALLGGAIVYFGYSSARNFLDYRKYLDRYRETGDSEYKSLYEARFRDGMSNLLYFLMSWGFSLLDAYVQGKLYGFERQKESALGFSAGPRSFRLWLKLKFLEGPR